MPRLPHTIFKPQTASPCLRYLSSSRPRLNSSNSKDHQQQQQSGPSTVADKAGTHAHDAVPGWNGRHGRDHAVKRPAHDVQAEAAQQGMKDHENGKQGSDAISRKDERSNQKKAKEEFPEAPDVIGMNDERGSKDAF